MVTPRAGFLRENLRKKGGVVEICECDDVEVYVEVVESSIASSSSLSDVPLARTRATTPTRSPPIAGYSSCTLSSTAASSAPILIRIRIRDGWRSGSTSSTMGDAANSGTHIFSSVELKTQERRHQIKAAAAAANAPMPQF